MGVTVIEIGVRSEAFEEILDFTEETETAASDAEASWGFVLDPRDNANYRKAFRLLEQGEPVQRLLESLVVGGTELPPGAFVVQNSLNLESFAADGGRLYAVEELPAVSSRALQLPRVALVETWFHDMDGGWTRYLLESYGVPFTRVRPGDLNEIELVKEFDVLIFPDADKDVLTKGMYTSQGKYRANDYRPEYRKAISKEGMDGVTDFLEAGGIIVSWGRSATLFFDPMTLGEGDDAVEVRLPVDDQSERLEELGLYVPGSFLAVDLNLSDPLTWGMPAKVGVFSRGRPVLTTRPPILTTDRRVAATFSDEDIVLSGYAEEVELLAERPALVWARAGRGQLALFGFQPQFRASTPATFKLIFNALLLPGIGPKEGGIALSRPEDRAAHSHPGTREKTVRVPDHLSSAAADDLGGAEER
jgi:hypothetical protein